jgi:hypothetical protein
MKKPSTVSWIYCLLGLLGSAAIVTQLITHINAGANLVNFFSFFTIESNILSVIILFTLAMANPKKAKGKYDFLRGAVTLYMTMTGIIYILLLGNTPSILVPWVNIVLHYIMPFAMLLLWVLVPPYKAIPYKKALYWLIYPVAYLIYSLVRGMYANWYPYPFIDPTVNGWPSVIVTSLIIALSVLVVAKVFTFKPRQKSA